MKKIIFFIFSILFIYLSNTEKASESQNLKGTKNIPQQKKKSLSPVTLKPTSKKTNKIWSEPITGVKFVWIPKGCFKMGSLPGENGESDEEPIHNVCVDGFFMGKYEITNAQFCKYKSDHESKDYESKSLNADSQPVVYIRWNDAHAFAKWLTNKSSYKFRLPTEAEWEYAARAGSTTARYWGSSFEDACVYGNVYDHTAKKIFSFDWPIHNCNDNYVVTAPVGSFKPNKFALYDMLGNVWEWCEDWEGSYSSNSVSNPIGLSIGGSRAIRGGSWSGSPRNIRSAIRFHNAPGYRSDDLGFRLLRIPSKLPTCFTAN